MSKCMKPSKSNIQPHQKKKSADVPILFSRKNAVLLCSIGCEWQASLVLVAVWKKFIIHFRFRSSVSGSQESPDFLVSSQLLHLHLEDHQGIPGSAVMASPLPAAFLRSTRGPSPSWANSEYTHQGGGFLGGISLRKRPSLQPRSFHALW